MATNIENDRLNIRIEIKNNVVEPMEVDEIDEKSEEEGEIRDTSLNDGKNLKAIIQVPMQEKKNVREDFSHYIELDQKKLQDRAKRFSLKPEEINTFTEEDLNVLYISLGINSENIDQFRLEAIHLRSSDELTLKDVTTYFMKYAPNSIEMIDDESYNIVWENKLSAARALYLTSQVVKGMPVRIVSEHVIDSFILDDQDSNKEMLVNENRQVELVDDCAEEYKKLIDNNSIDISAVNIPIPPGYWRLGKENIHSFSVLLRFSMLTDKKPQLIEKCNQYFKNPFPKDRLGPYNKGIFSRNKDIKSNAVNKDPWGILAKTWNSDFQFREEERYEDPTFEEDELPPQVPVNPELRVRLTAKRRLGKKQDEEAKQSSSEKEPSEVSDQENIKKTSKVPRMRMYADEEEEKIKRRKLLNTLKKQKEKIEKTEIPNTDLRNILRITNRKSKFSAEVDEDLDLSLNLKNRRNKLVFTVAQESASYDRRIDRRVRDRLEKYPVRERRPKSPIRFNRNSPEPIDHFRKDESKRQQRNFDRRSRNISVGEMYSTREDIDNYPSHKPKSKVALVIKTQKKPSVASAIRSRNRKYDTTSSSSDKDSSSDSASEESSEETDSSTSEDSDSPRNHKAHLQTRKLNSNQMKERVKNEYRRRYS